MYQIVSNTHRITRFVIGEAYKWLYQEIEKGNYKPNKHRDATSLKATIINEKCLTAKTYTQFVNMMDNSPFGQLVCKRTKTPSFTTDNILNYFVEFNGEPLPLGFILEFFEDEYEMPKDRQKVINDFIDSERKVEFKNTCRSEIARRVEPQNKFRKKYPCVFSTPVSFYVTNIMRVVFTVTLIVLLAMFMGQSKMGSILGDFMFDAKFSIDETISDEYGKIDTFGKEIDFEVEDGVTYKSYFADFSLHIVLNLLLFIIILFRLGHLINFISVVVRLLHARSALNKQDADIDYLEGEGIDEMQSYFDELAPTLKQTYKFAEDDAEKLPKACKRYASVINFGFDKIEKRIHSMYVSSSAKKISAIYTDETELISCKKKWRSGFVLVTLVTIAFVVLNVSGLYEMVLSFFG